MYRPEGSRKWDERWQHDREGLESWVSHRDIYEAGADAMLEFVLSITKKPINHNGYLENSVFTYGGPCNCEYECFKGLTTILEGKAKKDEDGQWVVPEEE